MDNSVQYCGIKSVMTGRCSDDGHPMRSLVGSQSCACCRGRGIEEGKVVAVGAPLLNDGHVVARECTNREKRGLCQHSAGKRDEIVAIPTLERCLQPHRSCLAAFTSCIDQLHTQLQPSSDALLFSQSLPSSSLHLVSGIQHL